MKPRPDSADRRLYRLAQTFVEETRVGLSRFLGLLDNYPLQSLEHTNYELYRHAHTVKGSAATLGFNRTSRAARLAERALEDYIFEGEKEIPGGLRERLEVWARLMGRLVDNYLLGDLDENELLARMEELFPGRRGSGVE